MEVQFSNDVDRSTLQFILTYTHPDVSISLNPSDENRLSVNGETIVGFVDIVHYLARHSVNPVYIPNESEVSLIQEIQENITYRNGTLLPGLQSGEKRQLLPLISKFSKGLDFVVYICGNNLTIADLILFPCFTPLVTSWTEEEKIKYDNLTRWYDHIQHLPPLHGRIPAYFVAINQEVPKLEPAKKNNNQNPNPKN